MMSNRILQNGLVVVSATTRRYAFTHLDFSDHPNQPPLPPSPPSFPGGTKEALNTDTNPYSGSSHNAVRLFSTNDVTNDTSDAPSKPLSTIEPFSNFLHTNVLSSHRHTPIAATAFHPHRMMLACSTLTDGHVSLFKCAPRDGGVATGGAGSSNGMGAGGAGSMTNGIVREWDG